MHNEARPDTERRYRLGGRTVTVTLRMTLTVTVTRTLLVQLPKAHHCGEQLH